MIPSLQLFRQLDDFYWDNFDSSDERINDFCIAYAKLVGNSENLEALQSDVQEEFEMIISAIEDKDDFEDYDKHFKKVFKLYGVSKVINVISDFSFLYGLYLNIGDD